MKKINKATVILLSSMLLLVLTLAATFSWFPRAAEADSTYGKMTLNNTAVIKSGSLTAKTYSCEMIDGVLDDVNKQELSEGSALTVPTNGVIYLKTIITGQNSGTNSITLTGLTLGGTTTNISVCNLSPLKTIEKYSDGMVLAEHIDVIAANNSTTVEWYLYNSGSSDASITISKLPQISYNN